MMNVLMAASEAVPYAKSGGLGDVLGALPGNLRALGADVRLIMPKYADIPDRYKRRMEADQLGHWQVQMGWRQQYCGLQRIVEDGVECYFIDNEYYFGRSGLYGYGDEAERFAFFCVAVLEALPRLGFWPDVIHCHDWQAGLIPYLLRNRLKDTESYGSIRTVFTIHNLMYQGIFGEGVLRDLLGIADWDQSVRAMDHHGGLSCLKGGIVYADKVTTVSENYAREIQTAEFGEYLHDLLGYRSRGGDLVGIVNGIDEARYDPRTDSHIVAHIGDGVDWKRACKLALGGEIGLPVADDVPLVAMVTRLEEQKGIDLVAAVLDELMEEEVQLVVLGTGADRYERLFREAAGRWPEQVSAHIRFDDGLARRVYAGADLFLMPSRFEPCGIGQLLALRYACVPIVRETGGLRDTVMPYNEYTSEGWGFGFAPYNAQDMLYTIRRALAMFRDRSHWERILRNVAALDFSWQRSAEKYMAVYESVSVCSGKK